MSAMAETIPFAPQRWSLLDEIARVRTMLLGDTSDHDLREPLGVHSEADLSGLQRVCRAFHLSDFERDVLLACVGAELVPDFLSVNGRAIPLTLGLVLATLPDARWEAMSPAAPLRLWRLLEVVAGPTLQASTLRSDECILHTLTGSTYIDERLRPFIEPVTFHRRLSATQEAVSAQAVEVWRQQEEAHEPARLELWGSNATTRCAIAVQASARQGYRLLRLLPHAFRESPAELDVLARLLDRDAALRGSAWLVEMEPVSGSHDGDVRTSALATLIERLRSPLLVSGDVRQPSSRLSALEASKPSTVEQRAAWAELLSESGADAEMLRAETDRLVSLFDFGLDEIESAALQFATTRLAASKTDVSELEGLHESCRAHARTHMEGLAQFVEPKAVLEDVVLPPAQSEALRAIAAQVLGRAEVLGRWGFADQSSRGLGLTALFAGPSGTGKTMAAEALAHTLGLDLYRIDLSQIVSKYIGDTEKNLRRVFDAAAAGGSVLFFDEADALFGKRSEVRDSHDRYANIEVSYLLQRMETHNGLLVLATNMKANLDPAFLRRIRFVVNFPFPDAVLREELWRKVFPKQTPTEGLDASKLARLGVAGGNIHSIALNAAFLACSHGEPVRMKHVLQAARQEYAKLEKPMTDAETRGWV